MKALAAVCIMGFASVVNAECKYTDIDLKEADKLVLAIDDSRKNIKALADVSKDSGEQFAARIAQDGTEISVYSFEVLNVLRATRNKMTLATDRDALDAAAVPLLNSAVSYFGSLADYLTVFSSYAKPGMAPDVVALRDKSRRFVHLLNCDLSAP